MWKTIRLEPCHVRWLCAISLLLTAHFFPVPARPSTEPGLPIDLAATPTPIDASQVGIVATLVGSPPPGSALSPPSFGVDESTNHVFAVGFLPSGMPWRGSSYASMLDATTGHALLSVQIGATTTNTPFTVAVAHHAGRVFIASIGRYTPGGRTTPGKIYMLDAVTGRLLDIATVGIAPFAVAVSERTNRVFVPNNNYAARDPGTPGTISMLDATTGALLRTVTLPPQSPGPLTVNHPGPGPFAAVVDEQRSRVIVATSDGQVLILDARTGSVLQARKNIIPCVMALDQRRGYVIVQGGKGKGPEQRRVGSHIYVLDDRTGRTLHDIFIQGGLSSCLIRTVTVDQSRDTALVAAGLPESNGYTIYQIDVRTGQIVHTRNLYGNAVLGITAMVQDDLGRHVYLAFGTQLYVLDGADGHVLGIVALPQPISTLGNIATVHRTGRVFVGDGYTDTIMVLDTRRLDALLRGG